MASQYLRLVTFLFATLASQSVHAFSTIPTVPATGNQNHGTALFSTPPPLSPLSSGDNSDYDDYTPDEVTKMQDVIVSLSEESQDDVRRARLQTVMQVALDGPNGGPKRFAKLFEKVLTQVGEQVQQEAREKHMAAMEAQKENSDEDAATSEKKEEDDDNPQLPKVPEKTPEELKLWALIDMMVQSKTLIKNHKF